jgi:nitroreductase
MKERVNDMNETLNTIATRYSCRAYDGRLPEKNILEAIAAAAVQSPSGMNRQPWRIAVITNKEFIDEMDAEGMRILAGSEDKSTYERFKERGGTLFYNAPCMFLILKESGAGDMDIGIVSENIALASSALGLGNVICGMAAIPFGGEKGELFKRKAGMSEGWSFGMAVLVGYAEGQGVPHAPDTAKIRFID